MDVRTNGVVDYVGENEEILRVIEAKAQEALEERRLQINDVVVKTQINRALGYAITKKLWNRGEEIGAGSLERWRDYADLRRGIGKLMNIFDVGTIVRIQPEVVFINEV